MPHRTEGEFDYSDSYDTDENGVKRINLARHARNNPNRVPPSRVQVARFCECHRPDIDQDTEAPPAAA